MVCVGRQSFLPSSCSSLKDGFLAVKSKSSTMFTVVWNKWIHSNSKPKAINRMRLSCRQFSDSGVICRSQSLEDENRAFVFSNSETCTNIIVRMISDRPLDRTPMQLIHSQLDIVRSVTRELPVINQSHSADSPTRCCSVY
jgi:hypothetical protein